MRNQLGFFLHKHIIHTFGFPSFLGGHISRTGARLAVLTLGEEQECMKSWEECRVAAIGLAFTDCSVICSGGEPPKQLSSLSARQA